MSDILFAVQFAVTVTESVSSHTVLPVTTSSPAVKFVNVYPSLVSVPAVKSAIDTYSSPFSVV